MTEFDLLEVIYFAGNSMIDGAAVFVSVFFAYVLAAHFVGKGLSRTIAYAASIVYSLFLIAPILEDL